MRLATILRAAGRESRGARGRLVFFTACLALGSFTVVSVTGLARSVRAAIQAQSRELLGADVWMRSRSPFPAEVVAALEEERAAGARLAEVRLVQTMARAVEDGRTRLVELKAVGAGFPFRGTLTLEPPQSLDEALAGGRVAVAAELAPMIGVGVGDEVGLGNATFTVGALVVDEPGRLDPTFTAGPRVFARFEDFERMGLGGPGSRITHGALLALADGGDDAAAWEEAFEERVPEAEQVRIDTHEEAQPQVRRAASRVERFLGLVALLSLILAGVGVAEIVRAWIGTRIASIGVLRVLGFRPREVLWMYAGHVCLLAVGGSTLGAFLGSFVPLAVPSLMPELLPSGLSLGWQPSAILRGVGLGTLVALAFSLPSLSAVWRVPPVRVLRHEAEPLPPRRAAALGSFAVLIGAVFLAARVQSGESDQAAAFTVGLAALLGLLALGARGLTRLAGWLPRARVGPVLSNGLAALARPGAGVLGAVTALGLGTMVVTTLALVETRLSERLEGALGADAPSLFFLDLQSDQREAFERVVSTSGAGSWRVVPMATARLSSIDGVGVEELAERRGDRRRGRWALTREQRLTWQAELTDDNRVVAGELWSDPERFEVSLEEDYAEDIGAELGSTLVFDFSGIPVELVVTSLREVQWESFGINFFLVAEPGSLEEAPHILLAAADVPPEREQALQDALLAEVPNVTVINVRAILEKVGRILGRAALAVQFLGASTAVVGLVLLAGVASLGALRRTREAALWKVLGVTRSGVARLFALEFVLQGCVAGVLGATGACVLTWAFFEHVLELGSEIPWWTAPGTAVLVGLLSAGASLAACARALRVRPIESLRG